MGACALGEAGDGDAGGGGVAVQVVQGGQAGRARGEGDVVLGEQVAGVFDGGGDGVGGGAEEGGEHVQRPAQAGAGDGGGGVSRAGGGVWCRSPGKPGGGRARACCGARGWGGVVFAPRG